MRFKWQLHLRFVFMLALIALTHVAAAADELPQCGSPTQHPLSVLQYPGDLSLSSDDSLVYRSLQAHKIIVEAGYSSSGQLSCATPLSGFSIYWPPAVEALKKVVRPGGSRSPIIVIFRDPVAERIRTAPKALVPRCSETQAPATVLKNALVLMNRGPKHRENARECLKLALASAPDSLAANYGLAITEGLMEHTDAATTFLDKAISLRPDFYEARLSRALLYAQIGNRNKEETELKDILAGNPPLSIQREIFNKLMRMYDDLDRRADALAAEQSLISTEYQLKNVYPPLVPDSLIAMSEASIGLRFEEQGEYREAEKAYRAAARDGDQFGQSFLFEQSMGRSRSLRQLGDTSSAHLICSQWNILLQQLGPELNGFQWHGKELVFAKWELSCGDFQMGLKKVWEIANRESSSTQTADPYRAAAPYRALETIYRARGEIRMAKLAHESADRIITAHSSAILRQVLKDAGVLF